MIKVFPFAITISRQLGSGGSYLGQRLATRLNIAYLDRGIVSEAAKKLRVSEDTIDLCDEKPSSLWQKLLKPLAYYSIGTYLPPSLDLLIDETVHSTQSEVIQRVAQDTAVIIIGRGGCYVLRQHQHHLSIFLHADITFRQQRIQKLYNVSEQQALKLIESTVKGRSRYLQAVNGTGLD
jgi:CMP/dCMP kinase